MGSIIRHADGSIDWEAVRAKLQAAESVWGADQLRAEQRQAILKNRANVLARVPEQSPDMHQMLPLLTFQIGGETFGIEAKYVYEVLREYRAVTVPDVPSFVVGVSNLRGEILAVMDLSESFDISSPRIDTNSQLLVLGLQQIEFGIVADAVLDVDSIKINALLEVPRSMDERGRRYLRGVTTDGKLILDGNALLEDDRFYIDLDD